jgi:hypothetical protein
LQLQMCRCEEHFCVLPSITNSIHWPATVWYYAEWVHSLSFKRSWLSWCFPKQEMKLNKVWTSYTRNFLLFVLGPLFSWKWMSVKSFFSPFPKINTAATQWNL